jgi:hypothetical protein
VPRYIRSLCVACGNWHHAHATTVRPRVLFTFVPIAAVAIQLLLLQHLGIFLCEWVVFLGEWIPIQASQKLYNRNLHGENNFKALGLPDQGAGRARAGLPLARAAGGAAGRGPQPRSRELAGGSLHRAGERGKEFPQEPQLPCCNAGRVEPPRRPAPKGQGLSE